MILFLDYMLLKMNVMENKNREFSCIDKTEALPVVITASIRADSCFR